MKVDNKFVSFKAAVLPWLLVLVGSILVILPRFSSLYRTSSSMANQGGRFGYKMKRFGRGFHIKMLASLFFLGSIATALDMDGSEVGIQVCLYSLCT